MRNRTIQYAIDKETGLVWSRVGDQVAVPILDFKGMNASDGYKTHYYLEKMGVFVACIGTDLKWTRKIHIEIKNMHRKFWGFKPLKAKDQNKTMRGGDIDCYRK